MNDALLDRLRAANPVTEELVAPSFAPPPVRRRSRRPLALAFAAVAALAVLVLATSSSPSVVAQAQEALGAPDQIIHTVIVTQVFQPDGKPQPQPALKLDGEVLPISNRSERWVAFNPVRTRTRMFFDGSTKTIDFDYADGELRTKEPWEPEIRTTHLDAGAFEAWLSDPSPAQAGGDPVAGVRAMLDDGRLRADGQTSLNGRAVVRLVGHQDPPPPLDGAHGFAVDVEYLVDASSYEPVQVTLDRGAGGKSVISFQAFERLPMDPALLRLP
jgi:hypothetical protein